MWALIWVKSVSKINLKHAFVWLSTNSVVVCSFWRMNATAPPLTPRLQTIKQLNCFWFSFTCQAILLWGVATLRQLLSDAPHLSFWIKPCVKCSRVLWKNGKESPATKVYKLCYRSQRANSGRSGAVQSTACWRCSGNVLEGPAAVLAECLQLFINCVSIKWERIWCNIVRLTDAG